MWNDPYEDEFHGLVNDENEPKVKTENDNKTTKTPRKLLM